MSTLFIKYDFNVGLSISPERNPAGYASSDVQGLVEDMMSEGSHSSCPLDGALDALNDDSLWPEDEREIVESIKAVIEGHREDNYE